MLPLRYHGALIGFPRAYSSEVSSSVLQRLAVKEALDVADLEGAKSYLLHPSRHQYGVGLPIDILKRVFVELPDERRPSWIPIALNTAVHVWKRAAKRNAPMIPSPESIVNDLLLRFADPESQNANSNANSWFGAVLEVLIHQAPQMEGPHVAEAFVKQHIQEPDSYVYALLLEAWASSGLENAREQIEAIDVKMQHASIPYTRKSYFALLKFWGSAAHYNLDRVDAVWQDLSRQSIEVDTGLWAELALGLARSSDRINDARLIVLTKILDPKTPRASVRHAASKTIEAVTALIRTYRQCIVDDKTTTKRCLNLTRDIMRELGPHKLDRDDTLTSAAMEIFSEARRFHKVLWLYRRLETPTALNMSVLLDSLVRSKVPKKGYLALSFLKEIERKKQFRVNTRLVTLAVLAWAKSDAPDAAKKALLMHEQFRETLAHDPPSIVYYNALLECVGVSGGKESVQRTEDLMEFIRLENLEPNEITYTLAIRALLKGGDDERADQMLNRMRESHYPPTIRTFNTIMAFHANAGVLGSAIQVEQMVLELHRQSRTQPQLAPDVVSYNIIYSAWAKAEIDFSSNRMMKVYDRMQRVGLEPNIVTFNTLIHHLSSTGDWGDMSRAQDLLSALEEHPTLQPDRRQYYDIMQGWNEMDVAEFGEETLKRRIKAYVNGNKKVAPISANFHQVASAYLDKFELIFATDFVLDMMQLCKQHKLPKKPELKTFRKVFAFWISTMHPQRDKYTSRLRDVMLREWPHFSVAPDRHHVEKKPWEKQ